MSGKLLLDFGEKFAFIYDFNHQVSLLQKYNMKFLHQEETRKKIRVPDGIRTHDPP